MSKGIKCRKSDKKALITGKAKTKLIMLAVSGLGFAMATFSGCDAIINEIEKPVEPTTGYMQQMEETTERFEDTSEVTTEKRKDIPVQEWEQYSNLIEEMQARGMFEERHDVPLTDEEYNELLTNLNNVLEEKNFSYDAELLVRDTFESLCNNYYTWQNGYLDMPSTKEYINSNFIDIIKTLKDIKFININTKEADELFKNGESDGTLIVDEDGNKVIRIIAETKENDIDREYTIEKFAHEVGHCLQDQSLNYLRDSYVYFDEEFEFYRIVVYLLSEGGATEAEKFSNQYSTEKSSSWGVMDDNQSIEIDYTKSNGIGYLLPLNPIEKAIMLLGYNMYDNLQKGKVPITTLESKMIHYYGEKGKEYLKTMFEWYSKYEGNWKNDEVVNLSIRLENQFLELIGMNINNIKSAEQLERYKEIINHYIEKNLPTVLDIRDEKKPIDITEDVFELQKLHDLIAEKENSFRIQNGDNVVEEETQIFGDDESR